MKLISALLLVFVLALQNGGAPELRPLADILALVSQNVKTGQDALPDFLCSEKVTSTAFNSGKIQSRKSVESIFSIRQSRENREILTIDGKPAKKNAKMPRLPVNIRGSFNFMVYFTLSPRWLQWYDFAQKPGETGRIVLEYETKTGQKDLIWDIAGDNKVAHDTGKAWIDSKAMQVARIERNLLNIGDFSAWKITIEQMPFLIGDKEFWLPKSFLTEITEKDRRKTGTFLAEYSDCKKFTAEITIRTQD